jgi:hypothetical protein
MWLSGMRAEYVQIQTDGRKLISASKAKKIMYQQKRGDWAANSSQINDARKVKSVPSFGIILL